MKNISFKFVREGGEISIVRDRSAHAKIGSQPNQRIKVMCFDSAQVERISNLQENSAKKLSKR